MCVDLSGGNPSARAVEVEPAELEEDLEIQRVWALSVFGTSGLPLDALSVCDNSDLPSDESGNLLNMIMGLLVLRNTWCRGQTGKVCVSQC